MYNYDESFNGHLLILHFTSETLGEEQRKLDKKDLLNQNVYIFHHWKTQTQGHECVLVIPGIYATQYAFPSRQPFGQFLRMMCGTLAGSGKRLFVSQLNVER